MPPNIRLPAMLLRLVPLLCGIATACASPDAAPNAAGPGGLVGELARLETARALAPRLSVSAGHRPCSLRVPAGGTIPRAGCGGAPSGTVSSQPAIDLAARAAAAVRAEVNPDALHAAALIDLLWSDGTGNSLQRSISYLQTASRLTDRPAPVLADLAATYLVRAERTQSPRDLLEAIEAADRAVELEPHNPAALFNLALATDRLGLEDQAAGVWKASLAVDSVSGWAGEAKARLAALAQTAGPPPPPGTGAPPAGIAAYAAGWPQEARLLGWDEVLGEWGEAVLRGDSVAAAERLRFATALGEALQQKGGDATLADAIRAIRAASGQPTATQALAAGHHGFSEGRSLYLAAKYAEAEGRFAEVLAMRRISAPVAQWATLYRAGAWVYAGQLEPAERAFRELAAATDTARAPALAGRARWSLGTTLLRSGQYTEALDAFAGAERLFVRAGEREHLGTVQYLTAEAEFALGDMAPAYVSAHRALMTLRPYRGSIWLHNLLYIAAQSAAADGHLRAAARIQEEGVQVAARTGRPIYVIEARLARARLLAAAGAGHRASDDIKIAEAGIQQLAPGAARDWFGADRQLAGAMTLLAEDPARASAALDSVISFFGGLRNRLGLLPALVARAQAHSATGDPAAAQTDLDRAITLLHEERAAIDRAPLRASLMDQMREVFDRMVMLHVDAGRPDDALRYLEQGRTSFSPAGPGAPALVQPGRPVWSGQTGVVYALVGDTLLIWTLGPNGSVLTRSTVDRAHFTRTIDHARAALELGADTAAASATLAMLYDWLIRPVRSRFGQPGDPLVLVADGEIAAVPFAALYDRETRRYLVQDYPARFASSLHEANRPAPPSRRLGARALVVADPAFDRRVFPGMERLPGAASEVASIAALYPDAVILADSAAHRGAVEPALRGVDMVHFAGHAVFDDRRPEQSLLVLARSDAHPGATHITAAEVERLDLRHVRLVVLSACETLRSRNTRSGGFAGLTGAFLAAGAGGVVGSLWKVDDELTRELMTEFHRAYRKSGDGARALRAAQLRLAQSADPALRSPAAWAGFRYAGN